MDFFLIRKLARKELYEAWNKVLYCDGEEELVNSCEVPKHLREMFFEQVAIHIYPYYIEYYNNFRYERSFLISPKLDKLCHKIKNLD